MRVFDCFPFYNEFEVLKLRLTELYDAVDCFVLVEADRTHTNQPKPLYFQETRKLFAPFLDKIVQVVVKDMPNGDDPWMRERFQRDAIVRGLPALSPMDVVIISDVDEIPRADTIAAMRMTRCKYYGLRIPEFYFRFNFINLSIYEVRPIAIRPPLHQSPSHIRNLRFAFDRPEITARPSTQITQLYHSGWHFSYLGTDDFVRNKIRAFAHQEHNTADILDSINTEELISSRRDVFGRQSKWEILRPDDYFPQSLRAMAEYQQWIIPAEDAPCLCRDPEPTLALHVATPNSKHA